MKQTQELLEEKHDKGIRPGVIPEAEMPRERFEGPTENPVPEGQAPKPVSLIDLDKV